MRVWRICRKKFMRSAFGGAGAAKTGGRWNHKGQRVVYASSSLSLAALELFVHLDPHLVPGDLYSVSAKLPDTVSSETVSLRKLPRNWRDYPAPVALQDFGSKWLREARSLLLLVPSAVNPEELNILINPLHPEALAIRDVKKKPFRFDPRMWKK